jgi:hypothetical protein
MAERSERTARGYRRSAAESDGELLNHTPYPSDVIALVVLWWLRYRLTCAI